MKRPVSGKRDKAPHSRCRQVGIRKNGVRFPQRVAHGLAVQQPVPVPESESPLAQRRLPERASEPELEQESPPA